MVDLLYLNVSKMLNAYNIFRGITKFGILDNDEEFDFNMMTVIDNDILQDTDSVSDEN